MEELPLCPRSNCDTIGLCRDKVQNLRADTLLHQAMNPFRTGKLVLFQVTYSRDWHFFEIMFFVILGIFGVLPRVPFFPSIPKLNELSGTIWCLCDQVQHASRLVPQETSWEARSCGGSYSGHYNRNDRVLQSVFTNRHDGEHVHPLPRVRGRR